MTTEKIEVIRYHCDGEPRIDCWDVEDYDSDEEAEEMGWAAKDGNNHLCPYCLSKEK